MRTRSVWALDDEDDPVVDSIAAGIGRTPARLLAYLLLRAERETDPTTNVHLQIGTGVNRTTISEAMARLESRDLVERTTVNAAASGGRPRTAWRPTAGIEPTIETTYESHARALLELADGFRGGATVEPRSGAAAPSDSPIELALNWRPNALHLPIYAAIAAEWYDAFGIDVRLEHRDGSRRALERVVSGTAELALAGAATVVRAREAGEPIVPVAPLYQRAMTVLYTVREAFGEPLRSVDQLEGRRVGMPPNAETRLLGRLFLSQRAFDKDVTVVDTNGEERDALRRGEADVVTGSIADPRELERDGATVDVLPITDHFPIYGPTIVAHKRTLDERAREIGNVLAGTTGGWAAARRDPGPAAERIAAESDDPPERIRRTFARAASDFGSSDAVRERGWGWHRPEMWDRLRTALAQGSLLGDAA
ncbi:NMT1/THI5 like domain protein [Haloterrigena turkmenica DSM 5511]|uniref:NMT1/THI5 like domain protein n=1 Tax=Haloterrigena turkmenica (strain ATCC 51198 / DSM 5511 / JCM 9101 / NCIMB 13204 / VKM B-1734 / 4k) TaxID=543526 RepID=D2RWH9_HALTV|nr:ABC transporter substrate-binding protein [Haloterrigena turkmenica]ADB59568.1 NMT1/THI5 like domain protein [Haloterrigena turkmenica DSM 5511]